MFKSKNTELKFQSTTLYTIFVIPHQENTNVSVLPTLKKFSGGELCQRFPLYTALFLYDIREFYC